MRSGHARLNHELHPNLPPRCAPSSHETIAKQVPPAGQLLRALMPLRNPRRYAYPQQLFPSERILCSPIMPAGTIAPGQHVMTVMYLPHGRICIQSFQRQWLGTRPSRLIQKKLQLQRIFNLAEKLRIMHLKPPRVIAFGEQPTLVRFNNPLLVL